MKDIHVAIIEDKHEIRQGLTVIINSTIGLSCSGAYETAEEGLQFISDEDTDVVLMDVELPGMNGIEATGKLKAQFPGIQVIILTVFNDSERIFEALSNGATGYLLKQTPPTKLIDSISEVFKGGSPMSREIARKVVQSFMRPNAVSTEVASLTKRERELLDLLSQGFRYKEIAAQLFISTHTVRNHIRNIYEKLHVQSKVEAINKMRG